MSEEKPDFGPLQVKFLGNIVVGRKYQLMHDKPRGGTGFKVYKTVFVREILKDSGFICSEVKENGEIEEETFMIWASDYSLQPYKTQQWDKHGYVRRGI